MPVGDDKKPFEEFLRIGPAADGEKIDELDEEARAPFARTPHRFHQAGKTRQEAIVTDPQEGPARHVADAGRLDHDGAGHALGKTLIPPDQVLGDVAILGCPPRHHGGNPGALVQRDRADLDGRKQPGGGRLGGRRHPTGRSRKPQTLRWSPH
jgi:hypothetical protein